ncbi:unnamed protein product, partial [Allacma fusca]
KNFGIQVEFIYTCDPESIVRLIRPSTKMVWLETPANPTLALVDIGAVS